MDDSNWFKAQKEFFEPRYLSGENPRQQSGFGRGEKDWERFRRCVVAPIQKNGTYLDIGCASGLLMEDIVRWAKEDGYFIEPYGLDISEKLVDLARKRLPKWRDRIFVGNALYWNPPFKFDYVRTELVYVPNHKRKEYIKHLLENVVADKGDLLVCAYGSARPEGQRIEPLADDFKEWGYRIERVMDVTSDDHGFVITRVICIQMKRHLGEFP